MKNQGICSNALILNSHEDFLLVKRVDTDDAFAGNWELPGGGIDYGETMEASLIREVKEECDLSIKPIKPIAVNNFYIDEKQYFEITYLCEVINNAWDVVLSSEHSEYKWVSFKNLSILDGNDYMKKTLKDCEKNLQ